MRLALELADNAASLGEVPVGCIIVNAQGSVLGSGFNRRQIDSDPTAHAEMIAIRQAAQAQQHWRLIECTLVVTLEPCPMCAGAIVNARIPRLVFGCTDPKAGAVSTLYQLTSDPRLNHQVEVLGGVLAEECASRLTNFFAELRKAGKK